MGNLKFEVKGENISETKFIGTARQFTVVVDEPAELGGTDGDANPVEYILAGLAGCINVVGHIVAKELGFKINKIKIEASGIINPNRFLGISEEDRAGFKEIQLKIIPDTDADKSVLNEWLKIVESRCPVKDNLTNSTPVRIDLKETLAIV
tara:strand:+ start:36090 stop:36542 length:453 start_codon:yes stop_codon:yes gene_type:complete